MWIALCYHHVSWNCHHRSSPCFTTSHIPLACVLLILAQTYRGTICKSEREMGCILKITITPVSKNAVCCLYFSLSNCCLLFHSLVPLLLTSHFIFFPFWHRGTIWDNMQVWKGNGVDPLKNKVAVTWSAFKNVIFHTFSLSSGTLNIQ